MNIVSQPSPPGSASAAQPPRLLGAQAGGAGAGRTHRARARRVDRRAPLLLRGGLALSALPGAGGQARARSRLRHRRAARRAQALDRRRHRFQRANDRARQGAASAPDFHSGRRRGARRHRRLEGPFDVIVMSDTIGALDDCLETFRSLHRLCSADTRIIVVYYSRHVGAAVDRCTALVTGKRPTAPQNWLSSQDIANLLHARRLRCHQARVADAVAVPAVRPRPAHQPLRRHAAGDPQALPAQLCDRAAARPRRSASCPSASSFPAATSAATSRPRSSARRSSAGSQEIIFVEGGSSDGTWEEIQRVQDGLSRARHQVLQAARQGQGRRGAQGLRRGRAATC